MLQSVTGATADILWLANLILLVILVLTFQAVRRVQFYLTCNEGDSAFQLRRCVTYAASHNNISVGAEGAAGTDCERRGSWSAEGIFEAPPSLRATISSWSALLGASHCLMSFAS